MTLRSEDPTIGRVKGLNEQAKRFHEFYRRVHADLETREDLKVADYAAKIERDLNDITAGMSEPRNRAWQTAKTVADGAEISPRRMVVHEQPTGTSAAQRSSSR